MSRSLVLKIAYFALGPVVLIGLGRFFLPFWLRWALLVAWAIGLIWLFIRFMEERETDTPKS